MREDRLQTASVRVNTDGRRSINGERELRGTQPDLIQRHNPSDQGNGTPDQKHETAIEGTGRPIKETGQPITHAGHSIKDTGQA